MIKTTKTIELFDYHELDRDAQMRALRRLMDQYPSWSSIDTIESQWKYCRSIADHIQEYKIKFYKDWSYYIKEWWLLHDICKKFFS